MYKKELFKKTRIALEEWAGSITKNVPRVPDDMWRTCPKCKKMCSTVELAEAEFTCPKCGHHFRIRARQRIVSVADPNTFEEWDAHISPKDPLEFVGYADKLTSAMRASGERESVVTGECLLGGVRTAIIAMEGGFMMGSMGSACGEKITRLFERALNEGLPVVAFTVSGGARMQEGILSLMQMAKTSAAVKRHSMAGLLYIVVLTDPTTGGVTASFAMQGDITLAEPDALVAFAGPRVIEQTIHKKLPQGFQRAEFLLEKGFVDGVVPRGRQREMLISLLKLNAPGQGNARQTGVQPEALSEPLGETEAPPAPSFGQAREANERLSLARHPQRPGASKFIELCIEGFIPLCGDRCFGEDGAVTGGIGLLMGMPVTVIAIEKGSDTNERVRRNFGSAHPEGYRKALRLMRQAEKFGRPVICLIDTAGAYCGIGAEERGQGYAIAENLMEMSALKTPVISVVLGEGGSGGALALGVADKVWMLENAVYSVISPEGCASILWKDAARVSEAAQALKLTAQDLFALGVIDEILPEPEEYIEDPEAALRYMGHRLHTELGQLQKLEEDRLVEARYTRFRNIGAL